MLSSTTEAPQPFAFFAHPKSSLSSSSPSPAVVITTRIVTVPRPVTQKPNLVAVIRPPTKSVPVYKPKPDRQSTPLKRKHADDDSASEPPQPPPAKKTRLSPSGAAPRAKRASHSPSSSSASGSGSRASTRLRSSTPSSSVEPLYRKSRSRSTSVLRTTDEPIPRGDCYEAQSGSPGVGFRSNEMVVVDLIDKGVTHYVACTHNLCLLKHSAHIPLDFRNPDDPTDKSFEPHPANYPVAELEFPNTGSSERFVSKCVRYSRAHCSLRYILLAPKDPNHYSPIMCLEQSLYRIVECE